MVNSLIIAICCFGSVKTDAYKTLLDKEMDDAGNFE